MYHQNTLKILSHPYVGMFAVLPIVRFVEKSKNRQNWSFIPLCVGHYSRTFFLNCQSLNHKTGQELVDIWPKTFLYTTQIYVLSIFVISQTNVNKIA